MPSSVLTPRFGKGLAVQGEEVGGADATVRDWLRRVGLAANR
jgi:hypothetical protein